MRRKGKFSCFASFLEFWDVFSESSNSSFKIVSRCNKILSLSLTFIYLVGCAWAITVASYQFFDDTSPSLAANEIENEKYPQISLTDIKFGIVLVFSLPGQNFPLPSEEALLFAQPVLTQVQFDNPVVIPKGEDLDRSEKKFYGVPCNQLSEEAIKKYYDFNIRDPNHRANLLRFGLCFDPKDTELKIVSGMNNQTQNHSVLHHTFILESILAMPASSNAILSVRIKILV